MEQDAPLTSIGGDSMINSDVLHSFVYKCNGIACALGHKIVFSDPLTASMLSHARIHRFAKNFMHSHPQSLDSVNVWAVPLHFNENHWVLCLIDTRSLNVFVLDSLLVENNPDQCWLLGDTKRGEKYNGTLNGMQYAFLENGEMERTYSADHPRAFFSLADVTKIILLCLVHIAYARANNRPNSKLEKQIGADETQSADCIKYVVWHKAYKCRQIPHKMDCGLFVIEAMEIIAEQGVEAMRGLYNNKSKFNVMYRNILKRRTSIPKQLMMTEMSMMLHEEAWGVGMPVLFVSQVCASLFAQWMWRRPKTMTMRMYKSKTDVFMHNGQDESKTICAAIGMAASTASYDSETVQSGSDTKACVMFGTPETIKDEKTPPDFAINFIFNENHWGGVVEVFYKTTDMAEFIVFKKDVSETLRSELKTNKRYDKTLESLDLSQNHQSFFLSIHGSTAPFDELLVCRK